MGTDLRTSMPTSGGWYHEQSELQQQVQSVMTSLESAPQPENTTPKDSGRSDNIWVKMNCGSIYVVHVLILSPYFL